ncbi:MAG: TetR/AcrR family transcriptional regulator [Propionibacterium sp.]|nr:TetR/AcrR family transcriptional regulator [Propionibacterium sp.]MDN6793870.1 TetR/AcrR family transcriptional regulator [Propionibacterium sp.]
MDPTALDSRHRLLDAMSDLLWRKGYAATSPREVMSAAEVGQGSFYHHFSGKHDLAAQAMRANVAAALAENPEPDGERPALVDIEDRLLRPRPGTRGCRVGRMTQDPQVVEDPELLGIVREAFDTMAQRWTDLTSSAIQGGELPADLDARELADALAAVIQGGYVLSRARGSQEPMDSALRGMVALLESAARSRRSEPPTAHSEHPHKEQS